MALPRYRIDGIIGEECRAAALSAWLLSHEGQDVQIDINTDGGIVTEGLDMYQAIRSHKGRTIAMVTGLAASIGAVLLQAFTERRMARDAFVMVHNAHVPGLRRAVEPGDLRSIADRVEKQQARCLAIFAERTGRTAAELDPLFVPGQETWLSAAEAVACGFADTVVEYGATFDARAVARLSRAPEAILSRMRAVPQASAHARAAGYVAARSRAARFLQQTRSPK